MNTVTAYFDQRREQLQPELSVYDAVGGKDWVEIGGRRLHLRSYLEDFLFPVDKQSQPVASLSGGERNRLLLARLFLQPSNLLILDEPTNDLDLLTLQVLEAALVDYPGCVLMVTHDRFFLDKIATALFVFEGNGVVHRHEGNFELYRRLREQRDAAAVASAAPRARPARTAAPVADTGAPKKLTWKEQREVEALEARIAEAEAEKERLAARLAEPALYQDPAEAASVTAAFQAAGEELDALYGRWAELAERAG
jgi:ATP-binding cassette subfamily F protein uup